MKLIRFDEDHFGYLVDTEISMAGVAAWRDKFNEWWPDKRLLIVRADEFVDLTGQYEIVPISEAVTA